MTRLQARRDREKRVHHRIHVSQDGSGHHTSAAGSKRRWTASLLPELHVSGLGLTRDPVSGSEHYINLDKEFSTPDGGHQDHGISRGSIGVTSAGDDIEMDSSHEGYRLDGNGRPAKRIVRR